MLACFFCWVFFSLAVVKPLHSVSGGGERWVLVGAGADGAVMGLLEEGFGLFCLCGEGRIQLEHCSLLEDLRLAAAGCKGRQLPGVSEEVTVFPFSVPSLSCM